MVANILCPDCEQRFAENGEDWVMKYCGRKGKGFKLKDLIDVSKPVVSAESGGLKVYSASGIPQIDVGKLTYFISSIMWRGSVHTWKSGKDVSVTPVLGKKYEEELRKFLLGKAEFPKNAAVWVDIIPPNSDVWGFVTTPYGGKQEQFWRYQFLFLGISFTFFMGNRIDPDVRRFCTFRSPEKFLFVGDDATEMLARDISRSIKESKRVCVPSLRRQGE
ncbi:MAG: hypothetical protein Q7T82_14590 [Armatimonadota bacterium]|nr:hypothetical protein [Armatimonadota bacterium]